MNNIKNKYNKICENKIKEVFVKSLFNSELSNEDLKILTVIERMKTYLKDYDLVEGTYYFKVFIEAFLTTKKRKKTLQAIATEIGYDKRSVINHKNKIINIFICFFKNYAQK